MKITVPKLIGIVNITEDSFLDGGRYIDPQAALTRARVLHDDGAFAVEFGPASSHPDAANVSPTQEIERLSPVVKSCVDAGLTVAVDSYQPETQKFALAQGVAMLNDVEGFAREDAYEALAASDCLLVAMHSVQRRGNATRIGTEPREIIAGILDFFEQRIHALEAAGITRDRLILDPGMGFFLGETPEVSIVVLQRLAILREAFSIPVLVSVSHKSFLGALTGREPSARGAATLAAELYAASAGVDYIRTHDVAALHDALVVLTALGATQ